MHDEIGTRHAAHDRWDHDTRCGFSVPLTGIRPDAAAAAAP
jgi:hypothetical protein